ncbi:hypothetical protein L226DRAFT_609780 [Lentinus tigrinus ALCF2SS1-7]|uniref:Uncharacterized protein n=1 Tax=Lentinus tigrinus ALCF2SS1-6 TaxID=1328759 RepID=A0A5C2SQC0_9APHY|nr:hypothetical protein L227DRAFT_649446 [Lentinus tigrinus ALCF2SS1-6]RPD79284.1 hypothetical protein L226DRAFT_609780 [Lentinus tigrinus ALCF2SS1-7]
MLRYWWSWLYVLLTTSSLIPIALAGVATADDTDAGMFYSGLWVPDGDPNTFGHHDTWTNQSGASVAFDFIGTQIQVFATRRPSGTYLTNVSFSIDGGPSTLWTTSDFVPEITYQNLVYTSPSLAPSQHHITITNFGAIFWLDYVQFTTADSIPSSGGGGDASSTFTSTSSTHSPSTSSSSPQTSSSRSTALQSQSPPSSTTTSSSAGTSTTNPLMDQTSSPSSSGLTSSSDSSSTNSFTTTSAQSSTGDSVPTALGVPANASSGSSSRTPIIIGVVVGVMGLIALLFAALWWVRVRLRLREQPLPNMMFATAPELGLPASQLSKDRAPLSPPQTPHSGVPLLGMNAPNAGSADPEDPQGAPGESTLQPLAKLLEEQASSTRVSGMSPSPSPAVPGARRPLPSAPDSRPSGTSALMGALTDGVRSSFADSTFSGSNPSSGSSMGPNVRMVRYSRDAGIRLAGGPLGEADSQTWTPVEYDEVETLPPSYAHIHGP